MLLAADKPLIVAGGGIINADTCSLLVELAEITGVPVIPTLMGRGAIPDDHPLMAGMCGLQTSHRCGNATMLAADFVLGIGNRWANRHTGSNEVYCKGRTFVHVDIEPTQIGRVFMRDFGIVSDARAALQLFVEAARECKAAGTLKDYSDWAHRCADRKRLMHRKSHYTETPIKPIRVYEEMNAAFPRDTAYVTTIGLSQIAGAQFRLPCVQVLVNNSCLGLIRQSQRGFEMDCCVQLAFENQNVDDPALREARALAQEHRVPVVVECILEKVTPIAMGTEIDKINEFEAIDCRHPEGRQGLEMAGLLE